MAKHSLLSAMMRAEPARMWETSELLAFQPVVVMWALLAMLWAKQSPSALVSSRAIGSLSQGSLF
jgi:hypothetical protein